MTPKTIPDAEDYDHQLVATEDSENHDWISEGTVLWGGVKHPSEMRLPPGATYNSNKERIKDMWDVNVEYRHDPD